MERLERERERETSLGDTVCRVQRENDRSSKKRHALARGARAARAGVSPCTVSIEHFYVRCLRVCVRLVSWRVILESVLERAYIDSRFVG